MLKNSTLAKLAGMVRKPQAVSKPKKQERFAPTPEQMGKVHYVEQPIVDADARGRIEIGKAYRRRFRFESIEGLGSEQLKALRFYRKAFDASEMSPVKSSLDFSTPGGGQHGSDAAISRIEAKAFGDREVRAIEQAMGHRGLGTLRAVALLDQTFSEVAMARYGSREVDYIVVGKGKKKPRSVTKLAPKSGAHREAIRKEFFEVLSRLVDATAPRFPRR